MMSHNKSHSLVETVAVALPILLVKLVTWNKSFKIKKNMFTI